MFRILQMDKWAKQAILYVFIFGCVEWDKVQ